MLKQARSAAMPRINLFIGHPEFFSICHALFLRIFFLVFVIQGKRNICKNKAACRPEEANREWAKSIVSVV